eukprot:365609-Chlamydomonas_euryale.AAC.10
MRCVAVLLYCRLPAGLCAELRQPEANDGGRPWLYIQRRGARGLHANPWAKQYVVCGAGVGGRVRPAGVGRRAG